VDEEIKFFPGLLQKSFSESICVKAYAKSISIMLNIHMRIDQGFSTGAPSMLHRTFTGGRGSRAKAFIQGRNSTPNLLDQGGWGFHSPRTLNYLCGYWDSILRLSTYSHCEFLAAVVDWPEIMSLDKRGHLAKGDYLFF